MTAKPTLCASALFLETRSLLPSGDRDLNDKSNLNNINNNNNYNNNKGVCELYIKVYLPIKFHSDTFCSQCMKALDLVVSDKKIFEHCILKTYFFTP